MDIEFRAFEFGEPVEVISVAKYLGSMISWAKPVEVAFHPRFGVAETSYKKMLLVWNCKFPRKRKVKLLFVPSFI